MSRFLTDAQVDVLLDNLSLNNRLPVTDINRPVFEFENDQDIWRLTPISGGYVDIYINDDFSGSVHTNQARINDVQALLTIEGGFDGKLNQKGKSLSKIDFMQLFTLPELTDIQDLQLGDPDASPAIAVDKNVRTVMRVFDETEQIDLTKPVLTGFIAYLKTKDSPNRASVKVLTAARATKILKGEPPASVI